MEHLIRYLREYGITDPMQIHGMAWLIVDAMDDESILNAAKEVSDMNIQKVEIVIQQVIGGS